MRKMMPILAHLIVWAILILIFWVTPLYDDICESNYNALLGPKPSGIIGVSGFQVMGIVLMICIKSRDKFILREWNG